MKWLLRQFASAFVRRVAFALAVFVLAAMGMSRAHAAAGNFPTGAAAYVACEADRPAYGPWTSNGGTYCRLRTEGFCRYNVAIVQDGAPLSGDYQFPCDQPAPNCSTRADLQNMYVTGTGGGVACSGNCTYSVDVATLKVMGEGANKRTWGGTWAATGEVCSAGQSPKPYDPAQQTCRQVSTLTECVKPNGDHCWTSSAGKSICWKPNETGPKSTTDGTFAGDRQPAPNTPTPPAVIENPTAGPTSQTTVNNTTYNSGTFSGTGTNGAPGQPNTGVDGDKDGDGKADGDGNGPGAPGGTPGSMYTPNGKTVATVFANFKSQVMQSPVINAANGFLSGCSGGGSCPNETWDGGEWAGVHTLQNLCNGALGTILGWAGYAALAGMCWVAFRFAFFQG